VPDATGLELLAQDLRDRDDAIVLDTLFFRDRATIIVDPAHNRDALTGLRDQGYTFMASVHGVDYYPEEPRLGVLYELLDMKKVDRITVKARVHTEKPELPSVVDLFPTADHQEREIYDMFGVIFTGHPDLRRILMPEDYEGFPQRRDFPVGGEPIIFTYNEHEIPGWLEGQ
jgi:NADH-quinone oxidoreductase subunit C